MPGWRARRVMNPMLAVVELGQDGLGGELGVEDQQGRVVAGDGLPVVGERDDLPVLTSTPNTRYGNTPACRSRRGPRGVQAGIAGSHAQELAACLTLPSEGACAIAGRGDYLELRQPGTREERMGWKGRGHRQIMDQGRAGG